MRFLNVIKIWECLTLPLKDCICLGKLFSTVWWVLFVLNVFPLFWDIRYIKENRHQDLNEQNGRLDVC